MKKKHSRIGLLASLAIHTALIGGTFAWLHNHKVEKIAEQNSLSMEMVAALLEQPQVAVAPDPITEEVKEIEPEKAEVPPEPKLTPEPTPEPEAIPDPTLNPKRKNRKKKSVKSDTTINISIVTKRKGKSYKSKKNRKISLKSARNIITSILKH